MFRLPFKIYRNVFRESSIEKMDVIKIKCKILNLRRLVRFLSNWNYSVARDKFPCIKNLCFFESRSNNIGLNESVSYLSNNEKISFKNFKRLKSWILFEENTNLIEHEFSVVLRKSHKIVEIYLIFITTLMEKT